jgi:hypothetical protein
MGRLKRLQLILLFIVLGSMGFIPQQSSLAQIQDPQQAQTATFTPTVIPFSAPDLINPLRGLYRWRNQQEAPIESLDSYSRYNWRDLEPQRGVYDFSRIRADLERAESAGRKHSFRIRAMVHHDGIVVPRYLVDLMEDGWWSGDTYIPDWNDPDFIANARNLILALGREFNFDQRLAFIDIGLFGNWGEWHMWPFKYPAYTGAQVATKENREALVDMHIEAFPDVPLVMMTEDDETLMYALRKSKFIGWRRDSLGSWVFDENAFMRDLRLRPDDWQIFIDRWKTAPVVTEFITPFDQEDPEVYERALRQVREYHVSMVSNGNTFDWEDISWKGRRLFLELGKTAGYRFELKSLTIPTTVIPGEGFAADWRWKNIGNAPPYELWRVLLQFRSPDRGAVVWQNRSGIDLRRMLPTGKGEWTYIDQFTLRKEVPVGIYDVYVQVIDPLGYRQPLALAIEGRQSNGAYPLGQVRVATSTVPLPLLDRVYFPLVRSGVVR